MLTLYQLEESITILKRRQKLPQIKEMKGVVHLNDEKGSGVRMDEQRLPLKNY